MPLMRTYLYDDPVVDADVTGVDFDVVVGGDCDDLQLLFGRGLKVLVLNTQPLRAGAVELAKQRHHASLLARTGGTVHQQVGKVARTSLAKKTDITDLACFTF